MTGSALLLPVLVPAAGGAACLACGRRAPRAAAILLVAAMGAEAAIAVALAAAPPALLVLPLGAFDLALALRLDALAALALVAAAVLAFLIAIYAARFMSGRPGASAFHASFLFTIAGADGALLADHLAALLFFWGSLLVTLYVMIAVGGPAAHRTASKAFFITAVADLCMLAGAGLVLYVAHDARLSALHLSTRGAGGAAFVLLALGAAAKAGAMPFHGWIPDAALDAPAPFMAFAPGVTEKILGVYLLARLSLDVFTVEAGWARTFLLTLGAATLLCAVLLALVQRDMKRLLAFHAISQVGYMILGLGSGVAAGIVGGLFHMVNHAMYKGTLFLTAGAVERQAGTTDLRQLGGLARRMPVTFACFAVAALSISGAPPFNGFYSKELVYEGALACGAGWYAVALAGSFFTAASFLKLGHAAFGAALRAPRPVAEAPLAMLAPMVALAALCALFGLGNALPLDGLVIPAVAAHLGPLAHPLSGPLPASWALTGATVLVLAAAVANHRFGVRRSGTPLGAADHLHHAPVARELYAAAERGALDPYALAARGLARLAAAAAAIDRAVDRGLERGAAVGAGALAAAVHRAHDGHHARYLAWVLAGAGCVYVYLLAGGW